mmetsp:Transcript_1791/g.3048  ORF Transcript_1791/g.3048 Transcript_1791/m.3048 type:complete len:121 (+) Transcript_1791:116-478(+)
MISSPLADGAFGVDGVGSTGTYVDCCFFEDVVDADDGAFVDAKLRGASGIPNEGDIGGALAFEDSNPPPPPSMELGFNPDPPPTGMLYPLGAAMGLAMSSAFSGTLGFQSTSCSSAIFSK